MILTKNARPWLAPIGFVVLGLAFQSFAFAGVSETCKASYDSWLSRYGDSSPYLAVQKTTPWPLSKSVLSQLPSPDLKISDEDLKPFDFSSDDEREQAKDDFRNKIKELRPLTSRDLAIRRNLLDFTARHPKDGKTLSLAYMGVYHAIDLYIAKPEMGATYVNKPFQLGTLTTSKKRRELETALGTTSLPPTIADAAGAFYILPYLATAESLKEMNKTFPTESFASQGADKNLLIVSELHGLVSTEWIKQLPDAGCLKDLGFQKIRLGMEGYPKGARFTLEGMLLRRSYLEQFNYQARKLDMSLDELLARAKIPESLQKDLKAGKVEDNPAVSALVRQLVKYRDAGIVIELEGTEAASYDALQHR